MAQQNEEAGPSFSSNPEKAGTVIRIRVENFMCHSSLSIDFIDHVNFITGQNGSGKSAILTALCVAFGIKARGTQRATSLKDFIKNGCSQALVVVEIKNEGADSFKPDDYGRKIIIERKITESGNTSVLKDSQGKKIASKKEELQELVDHFNIDVENPCVIMTQDKSREFLHAGSGKEKFKFFFKATLLQQVSDLHKHVQSNIEAAYAIVREMEQELQPQIEMHKQLEEKLQTVERVESMSQRVGILDNLHAWSEVHDVDYNLKQASIKLEKYKIRIPTCEDKIRRSKEALEKHRAEHTAKKETISSMLQKTEELRHKQDELQHKLSQATKEKVQLDEEHNSRRRAIQQMMERVQWLQRQIVDIRERHVQASQAEEHEREESFRKLQAVIDEANEEIKRLKQEESQLEIKVNMTSEEMRKIREELEEKQREHRDLQGQIRRLQNQRVNKVTAFGGETILRLLQAIEKHHAEFTKPPLGPVGAHVALIGDDSWALALEVAIGKLLNAFVVTNHKDLLLLRDCAKSCGHENLQIIIYDFGRPLLNIPPHMVPDRSLVTVMSVLCTEIPTIMNVLVDQGSVERQVLVKDYDMGKKVIFEGRNPNVKEAYTMDGTRMFARGGSQTTLPPDSRIRSGRLSAAVDDQITRVEEELSRISQEIRSMESRKRSFEGNLLAFKEETHYFKRRRIELERHVTTKQLCLRDLKSSAQAEALDKDPDVDELEQEILRLQSEIQSKEDLLEKLKIRIAQAQEKTTAARSSLDALCESARGDIEALQEAENSLVSIEEEMAQAANGEAHFTKIMQDRIIPDIRNQEAEVERLTKKREELAAKAAEKCSEEEASGLDGSEWSTEQIRKERAWLQEKLRHEERRNEESGDQLRSKSRKLKQRIETKQNQYSFYKLKLDMVQKALELRKTKFDRNTSLLKRQLHWQFNSHLRKKGMSGKIQVDLASETLSIQVQMPQDSSNNLVRDTRGLSGGERSFSTLCFALALHEMTEAPFRAMDEFDVFMDAVSRKISLDTVVDFAVAHGSQWIFITPHDISMVKAGPRVKKQQMAAPRP